MDAEKNGNRYLFALSSACNRHSRDVLSVNTVCLCLPLCPLCLLLREGTRNVVHWTKLPLSTASCCFLLCDTNIKVCVSSDVASSFTCRQLKHKNETAAWEDALFYYSETIRADVSLLRFQMNPQDVVFHSFYGEFLMKVRMKKIHFCVYMKALKVT